MNCIKNVTFHVPRSMLKHQGASSALWDGNIWLRRAILRLREKRMSTTVRIWYFYASCDCRKPVLTTITPSTVDKLTSGSVAKLALAYGYHDATRPCLDLLSDLTRTYMENMCKALRCVVDNEALTGTCWWGSGEIYISLIYFRLK